MALITCVPVEEESRPYEFGFDIGTQHRTEKKDEKGIVTGEYGFLTADSYYNVVKYATDEQGRFRILERKRIRVTTPAPTTTTTPAPQERSEPRQEPPTTTERVEIYSFNYTATPIIPEPKTFGHQETGFSDTSKVGGYFWDGPDGIRRTVTYVADDNGGYRPRISSKPIPTN